MTEKAMFREASQSRIFQDVVHQIQEAILKGRLETGDTLRSERELKEMFNTSRGTLREALRVLEERGLIEIRLGVRGGAVVKKVSPQRATESLGLLIRSRRVSLNHLTEFREGLEGSVAALAAQRATDEDVAALKTLLAEARGHIHCRPPDRDGFIEVDKRFHMALARISHNPVYVFVFHSVHDNIHRYYERFLSMEERELTENYQDLCDIADAVESGDTERARILAQGHVLRFHRYMKDRESRLQEDAGPEQSN